MAESAASTLARATTALDMSIVGAAGAASAVAGGGGLVGLGTASQSLVSTQALLDETAAATAALAQASGGTNASSPLAASAPSQYSLIGYDGRPLAAISTALDQRCQTAVADVLQRERNQEPVPLYADPLEAINLRPRNATEHGVRIVYLIGIGARPSAHYVVSRLLYALFSPVDLFLMHLDIKAAPEAAKVCYQLERKYAANVRVLRARRLVQWGTFSMVAIALDAIKSALDASVEFDFFINLSDADISLRTNAEMASFLARMKGRSLINIHEGGGPALNDAVRIINANTMIECGGYGIVVVNKTKDTYPLTHGCCVGRSGPAAFAQLPVGTHELLRSDDTIYTGSQWAALSFDFCRYLITSGRARQYISAFERRLVPDESIFQTIMMNSPFRRRLVNHNMRWIEWPHQTYQDPNKYWEMLGARQYVGGPRVLNVSDLSAVLTSPYMFARKVDVEKAPEVLRIWDEWMARKLAGERPPRNLPQAPIGHSPGDPALSLRFRAPGMHLDEGVIKRRLSRRIARVDFEDGTACGCGDACEAMPSGCCGERLCGARFFRNRGVGSSANTTNRSDTGGDPTPDRTNEVVSGGGPVATAPPRLRPTSEVAGTGDGADDAEDDFETAPLDELLDPTAPLSRPLEPCPEPTPNARSGRDGEPMVVHWLNTARFPVELYIVDFEGREVAQQPLRRLDGSRGYNTTEGLVWRARTRTGQLLMEASPTRAQGTSKLNLDNVVTLTVHECRLPRRGSAALLWYAAWRNAAAAAAARAAGPGGGAGAPST